MKFLVPPVERNLTPCEFSMRRISSNPSLWNTDISAVLISFMSVILECGVNVGFFKVQIYGKK